MSNMANDVRAQYQRAFATIANIANAFPQESWLKAHGDEYYIPSRIAYHLAVFTDGMVAGGSQDPDFRAKLPFGAWMEGTAETLPTKEAFIGYFNAVVERANKALEGIDDEGLCGPIDPARARMGATQIAFHLYSMRELSAHTGELNKMLIENGIDDIWS